MADYETLYWKKRVITTCSLSSCIIPPANEVTHEIQLWGMDPRSSISFLFFSCVWSLCNQRKKKRRRLAQGRWHGHTWAWKREKKSSKTYKCAWASKPQDPKNQCAVPVQELQVPFLSQAYETMDGHLVQLVIGACRSAVAEARFWDEAYWRHWLWGFVFRSTWGTAGYWGWWQQRGWVLHIVSQPRAIVYKAARTVPPVPWLASTRAMRRHQSLKWFLWLAICRSSRFPF